MVRKDPVTEEMHQRVQTRDASFVKLMLAEAGLPELAIARFFWTHPICVAPWLDSSEWGTCWGRSTLDHVKAEPRMGKRAESDEGHLVSLCEAHTENGIRAGYQWNTAHRPELRLYLRDINAPVN